MNIAEIMRIRKGKKFDSMSYKLRDIIKESFSFEDKKIQEKKMEKLAKDKKKENKNATQETQLVKITNYKNNDKENNINIKKIEEIGSVNEIKDFLLVFLPMRDPNTIWEHGKAILSTAMRLS
mgnify:CR=1 FL=1